MAIFGSYYYNMALATTNTELIVNAVILLFINDLDEQLMNAMQALAPDWVDERIEEVRATLSSPQFQASETTPAASEDNFKTLNKERNPASSLSEEELSNGFDTVMPIEPAIEAVYMRSARQSSYREQSSFGKSGW